VPDDVERLYRLLLRHLGAGCAVASTEIEGLLGLGDRDVRRAVAVLVRDWRVPVCSSMRDGRHGYYLPNSLHEALASLDPHVKHGRSELGSAYRLKRCAQDFFEGQGCFGFGEVDRRVYYGRLVAHRGRPWPTAEPTDGEADAVAAILDEILREAPRMTETIAPVIARHGDLVGALLRAGTKGERNVPAEHSRV